MAAFNLNIVIMAINGLTLTLALGLFLLVLWLNPRRQLNLYYALFLFMAVLWTIGTLLSQAMALMGGDSTLVELGMRLLQAGFVGASIGGYLFTAVLVGSRGRFFISVSVAGLLMVFGYQAILLLTQNTMLFSITDDRLLQYNFNPFSALLYLLFGGATILLLWFQRRRVRERDILAGLVLFAASQLISLVSPRLRSIGAPVFTADISILVISLALVRQQLVTPLLGRATQLETVRDIGLTITSRLRLDAVLSSIAAQATNLLGADGAAIYMLRNQELQLAAVYNMPQQFIGCTLAVGEGLAGKVALDGQPTRLDDYAVEWQGAPDLPLARSTFGSVIGAPLVFSERIQGILLVVQGRYGQILNEEDVRLLELLGPQAAVAIANSELFEQQRDLTDALTFAKSQLETVLTSTQNPVIAVDRSLRLIFMNPASIALLEAITDETLEGTQSSEYLDQRHRITDIVPAFALPDDPKTVLRDMRQRQAYIYELDLAERTYMCHLAPLGTPRAVGWVAVLNDVTELKELDRFKSQMVQMTSHDLKNPLFAAMSFTELLQEDLASAGFDDLEGYVDTIMVQLDRMNRTISSILDMERVQAGVFLLERCMLPPVLEGIVTEVAAQAQANELTLAVDVARDLPPVLGGRQHLTQVFVNLLDNAIKFTPPGGKVKLTAEEADDGILVSVADNGVGIPKEFHQRVFERFFRAQQPGVEHVSGSGLGLSLVRAIVTAHEGRVWLESEPGQGTTVYVWLQQYRPED